MSTDATNGSTAHTRRHPCCAGPEDADAIAFASPASPGSTMAQDAQATTARNDAMTDKGEDQ
ncbi:hypothetical protein FJ934_21045 [Mesorhizobium sp. B2-4-12]|uniref:hypothetical protein n=1 Tax=unclassified Mesorhizobium TaxID=325217 RepID=UPI00112D75A2|nr:MULTISPECIES: hypothetical protein [unclassified Mesorhizobium]TPK92188.1 hypothetical protein FJ934_21045 [Mesorhizobium sp. B2-4-12]UCI34314.1 hypothetical protein FJW03_13205 [Mesorhizobium sp. B4-1-4]